VDRERKRLEEQDPDSLKWTDDEIEEMSLQNAQKAFEEICVSAYNTLGLSHAFTSTSCTLRVIVLCSSLWIFLLSSLVDDNASYANLVSITKSNLSESLCLMLAFAQRANADINVEASIK
jgi:hypothetical protein